jgi:hypothetical protein
MVPLSICSFIEVSLACICACLATLRPLLNKLGLGAGSLTAAAAASDGEEARSNLWEGPASTDAAAAGGKNDVEVSAWHSEGADGDVEMKTFGSVSAKSEGSEGGGYRC